MIYDPGKNYLFVHIQKTGGTSVTNYLVRHAGGGFVSPAHLRLQNLRFTHAKPFVFSIVRNPWERLVSWYEMMKRKGVHNDFSSYLLQPQSASYGLPSFSEFIRRTAVIVERAPQENAWKEVDGLSRRGPVHYEKSLSFNQIDYLNDESGNPAFDRVLRFETIQADFLAILQELQLTGGPAKLEKLNANLHVTDWRSYYVDAADREWVGKLYRKDIAFFGFGFDA